MSVHIRKFIEPDTPNILSCWESASKLAHPFLQQDFLEQERYNIPNIYLPNTETWVAEVDSDVVGFLSLMGSEVAAIFVDPAFHGKRIGLALMNKAKELRGNLEVEVFKDNSIGRNFYAIYGFELMSESIHEQTGNRLLRLEFSSDKV